jgi:methionyl-tRNA formyltransferase
MALGAVGEIDGAPIRVMKTALVAGDASPTAAPGTVLGREGDALLIQCGDRPLRLVVYRPESDRSDPGRQDREA